jgi:hypothetical protein
MCQIQWIKLMQKHSIVHYALITRDPSWQTAATLPLE